MWACAKVKNQPPDLTARETRMLTAKEKDMKVLIACEFSGIVREAFIARGHDAWSCDILEGKKPASRFNSGRI